MKDRPAPVTVAIGLMVLTCLANLPGPLLPKSEVVPAVVLYGGMVLGAVGLVASVGLWMLKRWGFWVTIVVSALNVLSAAPGIAFAPGALKLAAGAFVVVSAAIIVLVMLPVSRRALGPRPA